MPDTPLAKKLVIKPHYHILLLNAPQGYRENLGTLPEGVEVFTEGKGPFDMVHLFVQQRAELQDKAPAAIEAVKPDGLLWISYPKKTSRVPSDLSREVMWEVVIKFGWQAVTQISIDEVWSALRFRPASLYS